MFIKNHMISKDKLVTFQMDEKLKEAFEFMEKEKLLAVPVFYKEIFVGILKLYDIYKRYFESKIINREEFLIKTEIKEIMNDEFISLKHDDVIDNVYNILSETHVPFFTVVDDCNNFIGIIHHSTILKCIEEDYGLNSKDRIIILIHKKSNELINLTSILSKSGAKIINICVKECKLINIHKVVLKIEECNLDLLINKIESHGFKVDRIIK